MKINKISWYLFQVKNMLINWELIFYINVFTDDWYLWDNERLGQTFMSKVRLVSAFWLCIAKNDQGCSKKNKKVL